MPKDTAEDLPTGIQLTPFDPVFQQNPYPVLAKLRAAAPMHWDELMHGWLVTKHDDVRDVLRDKELWSDPRKAEAESGFRRFVFAGDEEPPMLLLDDPAHKRLRGLVNKAFTPKAVEAMRPRIASIAQSLLAEIDGAEFDLIASFAAPLPVIVIAEMLGIDASRRDEFKRLSDIVVNSFFNMLRSQEQADAAAVAQATLDAYYIDAITARRKRPTGDLISAMVAAENDGDTFTDAEIISQCNLLLIAGNVTTTDLIGNGLHALIEHPDELAKLRRNPELLENAVEEMLRFDTPVVTSGRIANRAMEIRGCPAHAGQSITVSLGAANHDPEIYDHPERFDIERKDTHHQSFGGGRHFCLGAPLARVEGQEAIRALLARFPKLSASARGHRYRAIPGFRGFAEYWVIAQSAITGEQRAAMKRTQ
jgi:cytochrome P450